MKQLRKCNEINTLRFNYMKPLFLYLFVFCLQTSSAQILHSDILLEMNKIGKTHQLIGMGEATHGTSEFITYRAEIFKSLVKNSKYQILFLEMEKYDTDEINLFIQGKFDDEGIIMQKLPLPYQCKEFMEFLHWIRNHNQYNRKKISIKGTENFSVIKPYKKFISLNGKALSKSIHCTGKANTKSGRFQNGKKTEKELDSLWIHDKVSLLTILYLNQCKIYGADADSLYYYANDVKRALEKKHAKSDHQKMIIRNRNASLNILDELNRKKGVYWAHNGHISKMKHANGYFLTKELKDQYFSIISNSLSGKFCAPSSISNKEKYCLEVFNINTSIIIIHDSIPYLKYSNELNPKLYVLSIGSFYKESIEQRHLHKRKDMDALLTIPYTKPYEYFNSKAYCLE